MEISLENIRNNYHALRDLAPGSETIVCMKADAYGHGVVKTAWEFVREGTEYLGVATIEEAVTLRSAGIRTKIVLLSATPRYNIKDIIDHRLIPVVSTYIDAKLLSDATQSSGQKEDVSFFVALETGMGRFGFMPTPEGVQDIIKTTSLPGIHMLGIFSHFATADEADLSYAKEQLELFKKFGDTLNEAGIDTGIRTMANSAAVMALPESHFDLIRPGIALYGLYPSEDMDKSSLHLKPAMSIKANIVYLKTVPASFSVSYGRRFISSRESKIATIPIGYGDGLPRMTSGKARAIVRGQYVPIAGTICMDICMLDVTDVPDVCEYDEVVLLGEQEGLSITAEEIAANSSTNVYEVTCRFGQRLPRKYI